MKTEIINIGSEILLGDILNTNAHYLTYELSKMGFNVFYHSVVGDNENRMKEIFKRAFERSELIILNGGLGPTYDDLTRETAAKILGVELIESSEVKEYINNFFKKLNVQKVNSNNKQNYVFENGKYFINENGTAPGLLYEKDNKVIILLPGPPKELYGMFENQIKPYLKKLQKDIILSKTIKIIGIGESTSETMISTDLLNSTNPSLAPYAKEGEVHYRITAKAKNEEIASQMIESVYEKLKNTFGNNIYTDKEEEIEDVVAKLLIDKKYTISTAESCTGGLLSGTLINYPGISEVFIAGEITYANEAKINNLNISKEYLEKYGAVSEEIAMKMAENIAKKHNTNIGLSTTGIAGPTGGTKEKPVGLVYIGIYINGKTYVQKLNLLGNREKIRNRTVKKLLNELRLKLI